MHCSSRSRKVNSMKFLGLTNCCSNELANPTKFKSCLRVLKIFSSDSLNNFRFLNNLGSLLYFKFIISLGSLGGNAFICDCGSLLCLKLLDIFGSL